MSVTGYNSDQVIWLAEDPITGTLIADVGTVLVDVDFDASQVDQPGEYYARLWAQSDDPTAPQGVPVTMTVTPPATYGWLDGVVQGLGYCDTDPASLDGAEVVIADGTRVTLTTDVSGTYGYWLPAGIYTITVREADHISDTAVVSVIAGMTTTLDLDLRWLGPCLSDVSPDRMEVTLAMGMSATLPLTLTNDGGGALTFDMAEQLGGYTMLFRQRLTGITGPVERLGPTPPGAGTYAYSPEADVIADGSFEAGTPNPFWGEYSANFGTPICDVPGCGTGGGTGPRTGAYWTWLGGISAYEELSQRGWPT